MKNPNHISIMAIIFAAVMVIVSCRKGNMSDINAIEIDLNSLPQNNVQGINLNFDTIEYIPLETTPECMIDAVRKFVDYEENFFILTQNDLFKFSNKGMFISRIGVRGNGPGEYNRINNFCILKDSIYVFDSNFEKVLVFDINCSFKREIREAKNLKFIIDATPLSTDKIMIANGINFDNQNAIFALWNPAAPHELEPLITTRFTSEGNYSYSSNPVAIYEDNALFFTPFDGEIFNYNSNDDEMSVAYKIKGIGHIKNDISNYSTMLTDVIKNGGNFLISIFNTNEYLFINLLKGSIVWNKTTRSGTYLKTGIYTIEKFQIPFFTATINYASDKRIFTTLPASDFINIIKDSDSIRWTKQINLSSISSDSNPVVIKYCLNCN